MNNIPNLFLIGAPKSGTTALAENLAQHEDIFLSELKEPRYFDAHVYYDYEEDYPFKSLEEYLKLFNTEQASKSKYRLDASVFQMYSEESINRILELSPEAKFIIILRDPVDATISMFKQRLKYSNPKMREISENFSVCWNALSDRMNNDIGYPKKCRNKFLFRYDLLYQYEKYIPSLLKLIKEENLIIGYYEDYKMNPKAFFDEIFIFLHIKHMLLENKQHNTSHTLKNSRLLSMFDLVARSTGRWRAKLGLTGGVLRKAYQIAIEYNKSTTVVDPRSDDLKQVECFFESTRNYIKELRVNRMNNSI